MRSNSVKLFLNLGLGFRCLKDFLSWALAALLYNFERGPPYAIMKEGIMGNIHVKLYEIWTSGSGDVV